ncbi:hypothetical protein [Nocardia sp. CDC160]|nr:hypothetical protein [Nocardia sp. CDC160]MEC3920325.1 hypothetical protein [Nocardia sp. CDC160]
MSALTQDTLHPIRRNLTPEQREARLREAEKVLGRKLPRKTTTGTSAK